MVIYGSLGHVLGSPGTEPTVLSLEKFREGLFESSRAWALLPNGHTEFLFVGSTEKMREDTSFSGRKAEARPLRYERHGPPWVWPCYWKIRERARRFEAGNFLFPASSLSHHLPKTEMDSSSLEVFPPQRSTYPWTGLSHFYQVFPRNFPQSWHSETPQMGRAACLVWASARKAFFAALLKSSLDLSFSPINPMRKKKIRIPLL